MTRHLEVRRGAYHDSVTLMQVSREVAERDDVDAVLVAMATELNLDLLADLGFSRPPDAAPNDLVVAVSVSDPAALDTALAAVDAALDRRRRPDPGGAEVEAPPRTVAAAARRADADLALVSTPGRVAILDAVDAVDAGLDVMIFSDNVPLSDEVALKDRAAERGVLVMGPDCGTAVLGGVGLGFANVTRPGPVGIVAASGTGAQHLMCLLDDVGIGIAHCLGVGGRDLSAAVGGRSALAALRRLDAAPEVELIVLVSKPASPEVAAALAARARELSTPVLMAVLGPGSPDLTAVAAEIAAHVGRPFPPTRRWGPDTPAARPGRLRGLFAGGTLCHEAMLVLADGLGEVASNIPLAGQPQVGPDDDATGHLLLDFGDDQLTAGRPHPMIDPRPRLARLRRELADPACAVVLLDVVLGHAAHPDPAAELAPFIAAASVPVVASVIGTRDDPQGRDRQAAALAAAGAIAHASNAAAAREAMALVGTRR